MTIAVFGASGLVGRSLSHFLDKKQIPWVGTYHHHPCNNSYQINIHDTNVVESFLLDNKITTCINSIAERNVDYCEKEKEKTEFVNTTFVCNLAKLCEKYNIYLIHISTDYVFDGSQGPYYPTSSVNPLQHYGKTKKDAEDGIKNFNTNHCIIRVPVLYTQRYKNILETAVTMIGKKILDTTKSHTEDNYSIRRPVFIDDVSEFILSCMEEKKRGLFHFYNSNDKVTKYQIAKMIGHYLEKSSNHIHPLSTLPNLAGRPYDTYLLDTQYDRSKYPETSIEKGIELCFKKFKHPVLDSSSAPKEPIFYMIDLDGTLVNTDKIHFDCYKEAFNQVGKSFCTLEEYEKLTSIEQYCKSELQERYEEVKEIKNTLFQKVDTFEYIPGAKQFLEWLIDTNQNFVVVTNTSRFTVSILQSKLPLLQKVTQWITREDVVLPKPNPQPYELAKEKYWRQESHILGFENTVSGYKSIESVANIVYMIGTSDSFTYSQVNQYDIYCIPNFQNLLKIL